MLPLNLREITGQVSEDLLSSRLSSVVPLRSATDFLFSFLVSLVEHRPLRRRSHCDSRYLYRSRDV